MDIKKTLLEIVENIRNDNWEWVTIEFRGKYVQLTKLAKYSVSLEVLCSENSNIDIKLLCNKGYKEDWRYDGNYVKAIKLMEVKDAIVLKDEIKWIYFEVFKEHFDECYYSYSFEINNSHIQENKSFNKQMSEIKNKSRYKGLNFKLKNTLAVIIVSIIIGFIVGAALFNIVIKYAM